VADRLIIDASAIIAVLVNEASKPQIVAASTGCLLLAPSSVSWEVGNAFSAMLKRRALTVKSVVKALGIFNSLPIRFVEIGLIESLQVAHELDLYSYDA